MGTPWGTLVVRESPRGKSDASHTRKSLVWTQEQTHGDAELAVCKGHFLSLGDPVWWPEPSVLWWWVCLWQFHHLLGPSFLPSS